jgi:hypothetical protein
MTPNRKVIELEIGDYDIGALNSREIQPYINIDQIQINYQ